MNWPLVSFIEVCEIQGGTQPPKSEFIENPKDGYVRLLQIRDFKQSDKAVYIPDKKTLKKCDSDDILIGRYGASVGKILTGLAGAYNVALIKTIPDRDRLDCSYLLHFLKSPLFQDFILNVGGRAAQAGFNKSDLASLGIPLPPLEEQKRIATILDKADAIRRKRQQAIELADQFLRSVFLDMFGDPVTNPKGWDLKPLSEFISLTGGHAFKSTDYCEEGIPLVRIGNANKGYFDDENLVYLPDSFKSKHKRFILHQGDLLITLTGTVGKDDYGNLAKVSDKYSDYFLNQRVARINFLNDSLSRSFLTQFLTYPEIKSKIVGVSRGVRQANIKNEDILNLVAPIPPKELIHSLANIEASLIKIVNKTSVSLVKGDTLFDSLAQQAFNGELTQSKAAWGRATNGI